MNLTVHDATAGDILDLEPNLRPEDRAELETANNTDAKKTLIEGYDRSIRRTAVRLHGVCAALFGVVPDFRRDIGLPWLVASTELAQSAPMEFCRRTKRESWIDHLAQGFAVLANIVDSRNTLHVRWLKWAGFSFYDTPIHLNGVPFWRFHYDVYA
jgi:hypothetical protein